MESRPIITQHRPAHLDRPRYLASGLLAILCLLTVVWLAPNFPYFGQDSGWPLALNQAVGSHAVFGQDIIFNLGPWASVYTGQYHPATSVMMHVGSAIVAAALWGGLIVLTSGWRRWAALLVPLLVATVGLRDPAFISLPLLLLAVAVVLASPHPAVAGRVWKVAALLLLCVAAALLSFVKSTFGTQAIFMMVLALAALLAGRRWQLAAVASVTYMVSVAAFWVVSGQRFADLPRFFAVIPLLISGYTEGLAKSGPWTDIAAYLGGTASLLLALVWSVERRASVQSGCLFIGTAFTLFVAFKAGFVRHDEHALIAAGTLAILPFTVANMVRARALVPTMAVCLGVLAFITHHYAGYEWPSYARAQTSLVSAASGAWHDVADPGWAERQFDASMARIKAALPLPQVSGPSDIYSSGQAILLANGLEWSPRPVLQSVTVTSPGAAEADLAHLEGQDGHPPVQNVFFELENEDNRLPTLQDGLSWPALLSQYRVVSFDRGEGIAFLRRDAAAKAAVPTGLPLLHRTAELEQEVDLPVLPTGLAWTVIDIRPTVLGRLVNLLFRPPALFITVHYDGGGTERYRLLSALAGSGFLLTPPVTGTEGMLQLLLPDRTAPGHKPVAFAVSGESGTKWLWQASYGVDVRSIDIPLQPAVRAELVATPQPAETRTENPATAADACDLDEIGGQAFSGKLLHVRGDTEISGWMVASITSRKPPGRLVVRLTDTSGRVWQAGAPNEYRPDVAGYFVNQSLVRSGFRVKLDLSGLAGSYRMTVEAQDGTRRWQCKIEPMLQVEASD